MPSQLFKPTFAASTLSTPDLKTSIAAYKSISDDIDTAIENKLEEKKYNDTLALKNEELNITKDNLDLRKKEFEERLENNNLQRQISQKKLTDANTLKNLIKDKNTRAIIKDPTKSVAQKTQWLVEEASKKGFNLTKSQLSDMTAGQQTVDDSRILDIVKKVSKNALSESQKKIIETISNRTDVKDTIEAYENKSTPINENAVNTLEKKINKIIGTTSYDALNSTQQTKLDNIIDEFNKKHLGVSKDDIETMNTLTNKISQIGREQGMKPVREDVYNRVMDWMAKEELVHSEGTDAIWDKLREFKTKKEVRKEFMNMVDQDKEQAEEKYKNVQERVKQTEKLIDEQAKEFKEAKKEHKTLLEKNVDATMTDKDIEKFQEILNKVTPLGFSSFGSDAADLKEMFENLQKSDQPISGKAFVDAVANVMTGDESIFTDEKVDMATLKNKVSNILEKTNGKPEEFKASKALKNLYGRINKLTPEYFRVNPSMQKALNTAVERVGEASTKDLEIAEQIEKLKKKSLGSRRK
jgi:hypothetical protein